MNVKEIVKKYLEENNYDGLCCLCCNCFLDELMICGFAVRDCVPGHKVKDKYGKDIIRWEKEAE